jgi:hypothetical protein
VTKKERFLGVVVDVVKVAFQNKTGTEIRVNGQKKQTGKIFWANYNEYKKEKASFYRYIFNKFFNRGCRGGKMSISASSRP